jgi:hypothetical protein
MGLSFQAKSGAETAEIRVSLADANTHPSAGVCTTCYNHFHKTLTLTPKWQEYTLLFSDMRQRDGWGAPRPSGVSADKLVNLNVQIDGGKPFDVWVDEIKLLECKK